VSQTETNGSVESDVERPAEATTLNEMQPLNRERATGRAKKLLGQLDGAGAIVATHPANVRWLTGLAAPGHIHYGNTPLFAVAGPDELVRLVAANADLAWLVEAWDESAIHTYGRFVYSGESGHLRREARTVGSALKEALEESGAGQVIALDNRAPWQTVADLTEDIRPRNLISAGGAFYLARRNKDRDEVALLRRVNLIAEDALLQGISALRTGITEQKIMTVIQQRMIDAGARPRLGSVGFGANGALVDTWPSSRQLRRGDIVRFDIGCESCGYHADIARTVAFGTAETWSVDSYRALLAGQQAALGEVRPGVHAAALFETAVAVTRRSGLNDYDRSHCGHGIGLEIYEPPLLAPSDTDSLEEGMTLCIETPLYEVGRAGLQIEDAVLVTASGFEYLGKADRDLFLVDA